MKYFSIVALVVVMISGCSGDDSSSDPIECWLITPAADEVLSGTATVQVGFEGNPSLFELLVDGEALIDAQAEQGEASLTIPWDTTVGDDGTLEIAVRASDDSSEVVSDSITVIVDNTEPVLSLDIERLSILTDEVEIPVTINEANIESVALLSNHDGELATASEGVDSLTWDTLFSVSRVHYLSLEVTDVAGNTVTTDEVPVIVGNGGHHLAQSDLMYDPSAWVIIDDPYDPAVDYHRRVSANQQVGVLNPENIVRVISWVTWDGSADWTFELAVGQGICPHRGVAYIYEESDAGDVIADIAWTEVAESQQTAALQHDPSHPADSLAFPYNADPLTCGSFFGHVNAVDAEDHPGGEIAFEANFMFIYGE